MAKTVKSVKTAKEMTAEAAKRKQANASTEYRKLVRAGQKQELDAAGEPVTNELMFEGYARPPKGHRTLGTKKVPLRPLTKYEVLSSVVTLRDQATNWDVTYYKTASEHLYKLLADVYVLAKDLNAVETDEKVLRKDLKDYAKQIGVVVKSSTSTIGVLVSCVFQNVPRQRRSAYSIGLQNLIKASGWDCTAAQVAELIEAAGGIYELAQPFKEVAKPAVKAVKKEVLLNMLKTTTVCNVKDAKFASMLANNVQYAAVVTRNANGTVTVNSVLDDAGIVLTIARKVNALDSNGEEVEGVTEFEGHELGFSSASINGEALAA